MSDFVLGGIRSGKSAFAEKLAVSYGGGNLNYIATAEITDDFLRERIALHKKRRKKHPWQLHEDPLRIAEKIQQLNGSEAIVLLDSLDMWVNNLLHHGEDVGCAVEQLLEAIGGFDGRLVIVSAEVGLSLVPLNEGGYFCDIVGELNQAVANLSDRVVLVVAGLPHYLKGQPTK